MRSNHLQDGPQGERVEKLRIFEDGQGSDRNVLQRQKLNRVSPPFGTRLRAAIHGESRLQVSGCRDETKAAVGSPGPSEEGPNRLAPAIPVAPRRHAVDGILAEERDKFIEIGTLPGSHVAIEQPALPIVRGGLKLGPAAGKSLGQSGASALQGAVDRRRGGLEQTSRFVCRPAHHVVWNAFGSFLLGRSYNRLASSMLHTLRHRIDAPPRNNEDVSLFNPWFGRKSHHSLGDIFGRLW